MALAEISKTQWSSDVYPPSDDSFMLADAVHNFILSISPTQQQQDPSQYPNLLQQHCSTQPHAPLTTGKTTQHNRDTNQQQDQHQQSTQTLTQQPATGAGPAPDTLGLDSLRLDTTGQQTLLQPPQPPQPQHRSEAFARANSQDNCSQNPAHLAPPRQQDVLPAPQGQSESTTGTSMPTPPPFNNSISLCVEVGSGSGFVVASLARAMQQTSGKGSFAVFACDLDGMACLDTQQTCMQHNVQEVLVVQDNLLHSMEDRLENAVDLLVFNPPYVPTPQVEVAGPHMAAAWAGGPRGRVVIDAFIPVASRILRLGGFLLLLVLQENDPAEVIIKLRSVGIEGHLSPPKQVDEETLYIIHGVKVSS